ncbi:hypothetical protein KR018_010169 [Drosophila ironensis]|nr:hypothetical protein KR018_010169 [Drosophila ironensis]
MPQTVWHVFFLQLNLSDFKTVCPDGLAATLGFEIYKDLKTDDLNENFQPKYDESLQTFYLEKENSIYVPVLHTKEIDFRKLQKLQQKLEKTPVNLAVVDNTANILYYQLTPGFCEKPPK